MPFLGSGKCGASRDEAPARSHGRAPLLEPRTPRLPAGPTCPLPRLTLPSWPLWASDCDAHINPNFGCFPPCFLPHQPLEMFSSPFCLHNSQFILGLPPLLFLRLLRQPTSTDGAAVSFTHNESLILYNDPRGSSAIVLIYKEGHGNTETNKPGQGHSAGKWPSQDLVSGYLAPELRFLFFFFLFFKIYLFI